MHSFPVIRCIFQGALIAGVALFGVCASARVGLQPRDPASGVGVVFPPWVQREVALARAVGAGGRVVRYGAAPFIVIVVPEDPGCSPRAAAAGALMVVDPLALAACLARLSREEAQG
jgi:hypothetical protein